MKKSAEILFSVFALVVIIITCILPFKFDNLNKNIDNLIKGIALVATFLFFLYKILTGWLFINMNIDIVSKRQFANQEMDDLVIEIKLSKTNIDSVWLKDIQIQLTEITKEKNDTYTQTVINMIKPFGIKKRELKYDKVKKQVNYWDGKEAESYVMSPDEATTFTAYTQVKKGEVIGVEVVVIGTRPFYGFEFSSEAKRIIQWKSSVVILPVVPKGT